MTNITPDLKKQNKPTQTDLLDALKREIMKEMNCVKVGVVQSFNHDTQEAVVQIAYQQVTSVSPDGTKTIAEYPLLVNVPVCFPSGGGITLTFPVAAGDECILLFNDRQLDSWLISGPGLPPPTGRTHDLSDAIAIIGIRSNPRALTGVSTSSAQLRSDSGTTFVDVSDGRVRIHGALIYEWDCHGYGQKITYDGGSNYTIDNYTTGAVITTNTHPISPPGPP